MVRLNVSAAQEQQAQQQQQPQQQQHHSNHNNHTHGHHSNNSKGGSSSHNGNGGGSNNSSKGGNKKSSSNNNNSNNNSNNVPSTSSSTSSLNSNASSLERAQGCNVMVVPQHQALPPPHQQQQQQQQQQYAHHGLHHGPHHHQHQQLHQQQQQQQQQQGQQQHSPSDGSNSSLPASPPLLQPAATPPQAAAQIVPPPVCAVHHPQQHQQQQLAIVAAMHQAAAAHLAAAGGALGPPHLHHAHHGPPPPPHGHSPQAGNAAVVQQQQQQQQQQQHSQQQHSHENGHPVPPGPGVSPSATGNGGSGGAVVAAPPPAPPPGPVYIQYPGEFYPAEYYIAPHPHDGMCPQHAHHHQPMCAMPSDYGPTTVQMVSQNRPPPMPVPVQVPQGQVVQPYVNESGALTHVVLSPQQYQQLHAGQGHLHAPFLTTNGTSHFYSPLPTGFPAGPGGGPTHFHAMPGGHLQQQPPPPQQQQQPTQQQQQQQQQLSHSPHSPSPPNNYHKDERTQRQHTKLLRKLDQKQREINSAMSTPAHSPSPRKNDMNGHHNTYNSNNNNSHVTSTIQTTTTSTALTSNTNNHQNHHLNHQQQHLNTHHHGRRGGQRNGGYSGGSVAQHQHNSGVSGGASSVGTSEDGEESSSVAEDEDDYQTPIIEQLSAIQKPEVIDITSRSAKIIWEAPAITDPMLINQRDLRYNVLLSDRAKECKYKSLYKGESYDCIVQDLQPGQQYVVRLQVHYEKLQGSASEPTEFTTPPCEPDQPMPPKLVVRSKNSLHLRWTNPHANGSPIQHYLLEYDEGKTGAPASSRSARLQASQVQFVEAVKTKGKQYILTKLQPSTVYNFRLAAVNEVGSSMYSPICTYHTSGNPPTAPKPPTLQTVTSTSLRLTWERRQQDVEFVLQMLDQESGHGYLNMYNGSDCIYECCQLRRATAYQFRLRADNEAGASPWSTEVTYKTAPERPGHPGKPQVKGKIHGTYFKARWEPPADRGGAEILRYFLEICSGPKFERIYTGSEPEATCDRLQPGTTYQLRASCEGPAGISAYSEVATVTSEAIVPAAPPPPYYDSPPSPYAALLRLDKPDYNGGAPILEFEVQLRRAADMETEVELVETPTIIYRGKDSYCVAKDLKPGCSYEVQARALNRIGAGAWSSWFKFTAAPASPFAPEAPRVAVKSATQLTVNWSEPECNGSRISEYRLESAVVSGEDASKEASAASPPASSAFQTCYQGLQTTADLRNLLPFTLYYFRVNASNVAGVSKWSPLVNAMTPAAIPAAPQIKDYEFTANEVSLNWSEPDCNGSPITAYTIEYAERSITTPDASTEYTVTELTPETSYKFRVQAVNAIGAGPFSPYAKLTTLPPPPAPPVLECTGVGHNFIKLKWADGKNLALFNKFYVEMYVQRAKEFQVVYSGRNCMCKVNKLQEQTPYTFRICAGNDRAGVGDYSSEYIFSTTATLPSNIKAPRVAFEGNVTIVEHGSSTITGIASNIPSGQLPETPSSFIAGLGNLSFAVPLTLEWQHSKNSFSDRVEYVLQYAIGKDGDFKQIYRGFETKFTIENLEPGCMYQFRVCPIRVNSAGEDLPGQFTSAFRYQVPHLSSIDAIDSTLLSSAAGMLGAGLNVGGSNGNNSNNNSNASNASFHGHSHHSHHAHHSHGHSHHAHNHSHHSHHNSRHNGSSSTSTLHHRSVSASAVSTSGNGAGLLSGGNAIGFIPLGPSVTGSDFANFAGCDDPHHHHHHHHHPHQFHGVAGADIHTTSAATLLAATANTLLANNPLLANAAAAAAATHAQNGAMRRFTMKLTSLYTNRKRFTDQEKAVIFMVSFLFIAFVFATLVKMFMR